MQVDVNNELLKFVQLSAYVFISDFI